jgi:hypothetical protein
MRRDYREGPAAGKPDFTETATGDLAGMAERKDCLVATSDRGSQQ